MTTRRFTIEVDAEWITNNEMNERMRNMLVLERKKDQAIVIDGNIKITVVRDGSNVRLGVDAPREVSVVREELLGPEGGDLGHA